MDAQELYITAQLAQLDLSEEDAKRLGDEISHMLDYFSKMMEIDVSALEPTTHALVKSNRTRPDEEVNSVVSDEILDNAPELSGRFITIPRVL